MGGPVFKVKINCSRIDKAALFNGKKGMYLNVAAFENKDGVDKFGNDGFLVQEASEDMRKRGERGPIIGDWRHGKADRREESLESRAPGRAEPPTASSAPAPAAGSEGAPADDNLPF